MYLQERLIGSGGFSKVYLARSTVTGKVSSFWTGPLGSNIPNRIRVAGCSQGHQSNERSSQGPGKV